MNAALQCIEKPPQTQERLCPYCGASFKPRRSWQSYCSEKCRTAYDVEHGTTAKIARVSRLKSGVSVTLHFSGPAAERALNLVLGEHVRLVKRP